MDPFSKFKKYFNMAKNKKVEDPTAFALGTCDSAGKPHVRMVLLKKITEGGFIFFTNIGSGKGKQFLNNNNLAMCFYWHSIDKQVRITGRGKIISEKESDKYFSSRPRESQIGAWASKQSSKINSREDFIKKLNFYKKKFENKLVKRPAYWLGIKIIPKKFEFWSQENFRLHKRELYSLKEGKWKVNLLSP